MSFVLLGILNSQAAGAGERYFLATFTNDNNLNLVDNAVDSSNSIYVVGADDNRQYYGRFSATGEFEAQKLLAQSFPNTIDSFENIYIDSSDNKYISGATSEGGGISSGLLAKYDSNDVLQWQRLAETSSSDNVQAVATDSSGDVWAYGNSQAGLNDPIVLKYTSSGSLVTNIQIGNAGLAYRMKLGPDGELYILARDDGAILSKQSVPFVSTVWATELSVNLTIFTDLDFDSSGNIYVSGETNQAGTGDRQILLVKYNSSGTVQWQRILETSALEFGGYVVIDSSDNIYLAGNSRGTGAGFQNIVLAKYDTNGTIQWQRTLGVDGGSKVISNKLGLSLDKNENIIVGGAVSLTNSEGIVAKLPNDGSLTGSYSLGGDTIVYEASSLSASSSSLSSSTPTLTRNSISISGGAASHNDENANLNIETTDIG